MLMFWIIIWLFAFGLSLMVTTLDRSVTHSNRWKDIGEAFAVATASTIACYGVIYWLTR